MHNYYRLSFCLTANQCFQYSQIYIANFIHLCAAEFNERQLNTVNINQVNNIQRLVV